MSWPIECANCGKQTLVYTPGGKCIWCGKSPYKKEVEMTNKPEKMNTRAKGIFIDEHQKEIIEDIGRLKNREVLEKWGIGLSIYYRLKRMKQLREPLGDLMATLTEHERYLVLLGYQMAAREFLKNKKGGKK